MSGQIVLFPMPGNDRVILMIYTDNGTLDEPIEEIDIIDLRCRGGDRLRVEMLQRRLAKKRG